MAMKTPLATQLQRLSTRLQTPSLPNALSSKLRLRTINVGERQQIIANAKIAPINSTFNHTTSIVKEKLRTYAKQTATFCISLIAIVITRWRGGDHSGAFGNFRRHVIAIIERLTNSLAEQKVLMQFLLGYSNNNVWRNNIYC